MVGSWICVSVVVGRGDVAEGAILRKGKVVNGSL